MNIYNAAQGWEVEGTGQYVEKVEGYSCINSRGVSGLLSLPVPLPSPHLQLPFPHLLLLPSPSLPSPSPPFSSPLFSSPLLSSPHLTSSHFPSPLPSSPLLSLPLSSASLLSSLFTLCLFVSSSSSLPFAWRSSRTEEQSRVAECQPRPPSHYA